MSIRPIRIEGDIAYVPLTQNKEAVIDAVDVPLVEGFNWCTDRRGNKFYAVRTEGTPRRGQYTVRMHRVIANTPKGKDTDHIDDDGLNNRRANLRVCTRSQNYHNRGATSRNTSGYKGVSWDKQHQRWDARIVANGKQYKLGLFDTPEEAHRAYTSAATELHGEFARAI